MKSSPHYTGQACKYYTPLRWLVDVDWCRKVAVMMQAVSVWWHFYSYHVHCKQQQSCLKNFAHPFTGICWLHNFAHVNSNSDTICMKRKLRFFIQLFRHGIKELVYLFVYYLLVLETLLLGSVLNRPWMTSADEIKK